MRGQRPPRSPSLPRGNDRSTVGAEFKLRLPGIQRYFAAISRMVTTSALIWSADSLVANAGIFPLPSVINFVSSASVCF